MPLAPGASLKFRVLERDSESVISLLKSWDGDPKFISSAPEFRVDGTTPMSNLYEIEFPVERTSVSGDRITGELATGKKERGPDLQAMLDAMGFGQRR
jgi:hypothetical protein